LEKRTTDQDSLESKSQIYNLIPYLDLIDSDRDSVELSNKINKILNRMDCDLTILDKDLKVLWVNKLGLDGISDTCTNTIRDEFCYKLFYQQDAHCDHCPALKCFQSGNVEFRLKTIVNTGSERQYFQITTIPIKDNNGEVVQVAELSKEITNKIVSKYNAKPQMVQAKNLNAFHWNVLNHIDNEIIVLNDACDILYMNKPFLHKTKTLDDVIGKNCLKTITNSNYECKNCPIKSTFQTGEKTKLYKILPDKNITSFYEISVNPILNDYDAVEFVIYNQHEINHNGLLNRNSHQMLVQNSIQNDENNNNINNINNNDSSNSDSQTISPLRFNEVPLEIIHEISKPLTSISLLTENLKRKNTDPEINKKLESILEQLEMSTGIVKSIISSFHNTEQTFEWINVNELLTQTISIVKLNVTSNVQIDFDLDEDILKIYGNYTQLQQVFINLLNNAFDSMSEGGILYIQTRDLKSKDQSSNSTDRSTYIKPCSNIKTKHEPSSSDPKYDFGVSVIIQNTGKFVPESELDQIFKPFYTTKKKGIGLGLGLWLCKGIIDAHCGEISVSSNKKKGTRFQILLPLSIDEKEI